jgi:hypothetical protein
LVGRMKKWNLEIRNILKLFFAIKNGIMAEATIKLEGMEINIKSDIFSEKFMKLVKTIETFDENKQKPSQIIPKKCNEANIINQPKHTQMDLVYFLSDIDVKDNIERILNMAKEYKIEEYYNEKIDDITPYLKTYRHGSGFTDKNAREILKSILRKCLDFSKTDFYINQTSK